MLLVGVQGGLVDHEHIGRLVHAGQWRVADHGYRGER